MISRSEEHTAAACSLALIIWALHSRKLRLAHAHHACPIVPPTVRKLCDLRAPSLGSLAKAKRVTFFIPNIRDIAGKQRLRSLRLRKRFGRSHQIVDLHRRCS